MKKRLTRQEEFEVLKLVLDKFLWLGFGVMAFGLYTLLTGGANEGLLRGFAFMIGGVLILLVFMGLLIKEYEIMP
ncbi:hypothetical protein JXM83_04805 [Candidatus Woesearchaeota archaeon]|nr:hypothetical protein [Candidatus Woesearchaeota archaeon]